MTLSILPPWLTHPGLFSSEAGQICAIPREITCHRYTVLVCRWNSILRPMPTTQSRSHPVIPHEPKLIREQNAQALCWKIQVYSVLVYTNCTHTLLGKMSLYGVLEMVQTHIPGGCVLIPAKSFLPRLLTVSHQGGQISLSRKQRSEKDSFTAILQLQMFWSGLHSD